VRPHCCEIGARKAQARARGFSRTPASAQVKRLEATSVTHRLSATTSCQWLAMLHKWSKMETAAHTALLCPPVLVCSGSSGCRLVVQPARASDDGHCWLAAGGWRWLEAGQAATKEGEGKQQVADVHQPHACYGRQAAAAGGSSASQRLVHAGVSERTKSRVVRAYVQGQHSGVKHAHKHRSHAANNNAWQLHK